MRQVAAPAAAPSAPPNAPSNAQNHLGKRSSSMSTICTPETIAILHKVSRHYGVST